MLKDRNVKGFIVERKLSELLKEIDSYSELVQKLIWDELFLKFDDIDSDLLNMKSPIEQAFYMAMNTYIEYLENKEFVQAVWFEPQLTVKIGGKSYRVDFDLSLLLDDGSQINYAIECDGHDFHEKTKKQVAYDRQRERALIAEGYTVIRFTGSEIYSDPHKCADEVYELALNEIRRRSDG